MDTVVKPKIEILEQPPTGWFPLVVVRRARRGWDWVVLMIDVDPDIDDFQVWGRRKVRECWVLIPGKHRSRAAACSTLENMMVTRH